MRRPHKSQSPPTFPFGATDTPYSESSPHRGNDYAVFESVYMPEDGYAQYLWHHQWGNYTQLDSERYLHVLAHLSQAGKTGDVTEGEFAGVTGQSGWTSGIHLHWQVLDKQTGQWVDSETLLKEDEMLTARQQNNLYRYKLRRKPDTAAKKRVGKVTYDQEVEIINRSQEYKNLIELAKDPSYNIEGHAPDLIRQAFPGMSAKDLAPGVYKVKG